ncbi:hypothetical protein Bbelb_051760 [Branchiostoma belcheri]|nr:hypothetical protein Bbelb_051760 [Branchiostoma belcheri]
MSDMRRFRGSGKNIMTHHFREWFGTLGELRCLVPGSPVLALTATASKLYRRKIPLKSYCPWRGALNWWRTQTEQISSFTCHMCLAVHHSPQRLTATATRKSTQKGCPTSKIASLLRGSFYRVQRVIATRSYHVAGRTARLVPGALKKRGKSMCMTEGFVQPAPSLDKLGLLGELSAHSPDELNKTRVFLVNESTEPVVIPKGTVIETSTTTILHKLEQHLLDKDEDDNFTKQIKSSIKLKFFPPNTTSRLQPMDHGITVKLNKILTVLQEDRVNRSRHRQEADGAGRHPVDR